MMTMNLRQRQKMSKLLLALILIGYSYLFTRTSLLDNRFLKPIIKYNLNYFPPKVVVMKSDDKPPEICISAHTLNVFRNDNRELHTGN
jgi:hypothetical protein